MTLVILALFVGGSLFLSVAQSKLNSIIFQYVYGFLYFPCYMFCRVTLGVQSQLVKRHILKRKRKGISKQSHKIIYFIWAMFAAMGVQAKDVDGQSSQIYDLNISATNAADALNSLAVQTEVVLLFPYKEARARQAQRVVGRYSLKQALAILLEGSGLSGKLSKDGVIAISIAPDTPKDDASQEKIMHKKSKLSIAVASALTALTLGQANNVNAQDAAEKEKNDQINFEEVIVTGRAGGAEITKFESSNSITTFDKSSLSEIAPLSVSDVWAEVPGVWAETSGGQAGNNVFVRGLPAPGQLLFSKITVDGLPLIEEHGIFAPPDGLIKIDETIERVETIRGGSSSIFASNAPGGVFNHIVKKGTQEFEGVAKIEVGNFGHARADLFVAGPIDEKTTYAVGGFLRQSEGVRDPGGFDGDKGGSIRATITRELERGEITVSANLVNDKNIFYLPFQLGLDDSGDLTSLPGFDANFDTNISDDSRFVSFLQPGGATQDFDLSDGIRNKLSSVSVTFDHELADGWAINNKTRINSGLIDLNTLIITGDILDAQTFLDNQLGTVQAEFAGTESLALRFLQDGVGAESTFEFGNITGADNLATATFDGGNAGNGLIAESGFFNFRSDFDNIFNETQFYKSFDFIQGTHNVTLGSYVSIYSFAQTEQIATFLHEFAGSPRVLDVFAVDGAGEVIGALTQNGFTEFGNSFQNYDSEGEIFALYATDEWELTEKLRVDFGVRYESQQLDGVVEEAGDFDLSEQNPFIASNGLQTLADDTVTFGTGRFINFSQDYDEVAYSIGANYVILDSLSTYLRYSDGFRTPSVDQLAQAALANAGETGDLPVNELQQLEGGFKINLPGFQAFLTGFYSDFSDQVFSDPVTDANGDVVNVQALLSAEVMGIEAEIDITFGAGFSINAKGTFQDPELSSFAFTGTPESVALAGESLASLEGNIIPRIPETLVTVRPQWAFETASVSGNIFVDIYHVGDRFSDFTNGLEIPDYTTVSVGTVINFGEKLRLTAVVDNVDNEIGLTEGNPRGDLFAGAGEVQTATFGRPVVGRNARVSLAYYF